MEDIPQEFVKQEELDPALTPDRVPLYPSRPLRQALKATPDRQRNAPRLELINRVDEHDTRPTPTRPASRVRRSSRSCQRRSTAAT